MESSPISNSNYNAPIVILSSDDESDGTEDTRIIGMSARRPSNAPVRPLPPGMVLPRILDPNTEGNPQPQRIATLSEVLSTSRSRYQNRNHNNHNRNRSNDPYNPIRRRAILPQERQQFRVGVRNGNGARDGATSRRTTRGEVIDVEDIDDSNYNEHRRDRQFQGRFIEAVVSDNEVEEYDQEEDRDDEGSADEDITSMYQPPIHHRHPHGYFLPVHPDFISQRHNPMGNRPSHRARRFLHDGYGALDLFAEENMTELMQFLEANRPPSPQRSYEPLPSLKLSMQQEKLAASSGFTRTVPSANSRDVDHEGDVDSDSAEILCTKCEDPLMDGKDAHIWAPPCGHIICNSCADFTTGTYKKCTACHKQIRKTTLTQLFA